MDGAPCPTLLCTTRPELLQRRPGFGRAARNVTQIELRPLGRRTSTELAMALLPRCVQRAGAAGRRGLERQSLLRRGDGVPDRGGPGRRAWRTPPGHGPGRDRRATRPAAGEEKRAPRCAVLGPNFLEEALDDLLGEPSAQELADLARKSLVLERLAEGPGSFGFRHHLIRDVAYASLPRAERARLPSAPPRGSWVVRGSAIRSSPSW